MAYVVPDSLLYLLHDVPLDVEHKHTWYFTNATDQYNHFMRYFRQDLNLRITDSQYIRAEEGSIKVPFPISHCINCNYMMFGNQSFEQKWFYAFITNVEYVSNDVTRIYYEIDELQTWLMTCRYQECFIERQHQVSDVAGDNLIPEGLDTGEYVIDWNGMPIELSRHYIIVASTLNTSGEVIQGSIINRVYSGIGYTIFNMDSEGVQNANAFLAALQSSGTNNSVIGVFMCPQFLFGEPPYFYSYINRPTSLNGYTPRNKKLLTYPYTFAYVTNLQGIAADYRWEFFSSPTAQFLITGAIACDPQLILAPVNYKGAVNNYDEAMLVGGFPKCTYNTDSFKAWVAQQVGPLANAAINVFADTAGLTDELGVGGYGPMYTDNPSIWTKFVGAVGNTIRQQKDVIANMPGSKLTSKILPKNDDVTVASHLKALVNRYIKPPQSVGGCAASALFSVNNVGFVIAIKSITSNYAERLDKFFDRYGYVINTIAAPNIHARKGWTYIRTKNCVVEGELPASSAKFIENCFDAGITFWNPNYTIGDYTQDNSPGGI